MKKLIKFSKIAIIFTLLFVSTTLISGCVKTVKLVGYTFDNSKVKQLVIGKTRKAIVKRELGSPSATSTYGKDTWYYISTEYESISFLKPKIKSQTVLAISFNKNQTIKSIKEYDEKDAKEIRISNDITKTEGHDEGILGQLLGNVGRFNNNDRDVAKPRGN